MRPVNFVLSYSRLPMFRKLQLKLVIDLPYNKELFTFLAFGLSLTKTIINKIIFFLSHPFPCQGDRLPVASQKSSQIPAAGFTPGQTPIKSPEAKKLKVDTKMETPEVVPEHGVGIDSKPTMVLGDTPSPGTPLPTPRDLSSMFAACESEVPTPRPPVFDVSGLKNAGWETFTFVEPPTR